MQYDVLDMPGNRGPQRRFAYNRPTRTVAEYASATDSLHSQATVLREEQDENGEMIYRRVPQTTYPQPDSHYVIVRNTEEEIAWQIYAGPFDVITAMEIAEALRTRADKE